MNTRIKPKHSLLIAISAFLVTGSLGIHAAPGPITQSPLYLASGVQPNIFFVIDDSGSMDWEDLLNQGTSHPGDSLMGYDGLDFTPDDVMERRLVCRGYNVMAYDPTRKYTPWAGVDSTGQPYKDLTLTTARFNPYFTGTTDISSHHYVVWTDMDADNEYDGPASGGGGSPWSNPWDATDECANTTVAVSSLTTAEKTNYANYWSYFRKREYSAKRALSQIIYESTVRMGLGTLHNHDNVGTPIQDMTDTTGNPTFKETLLDKLFQLDPDSGTPLRLALRNAGNYFEGVSTGVSSLFGYTPASPILSSANGGSCQQNFTVLMSDGVWNGGSPGVGNTDGPGDGDTIYDGGSYADGWSDTLADVAMNYFERDLRPGYADLVPTIPGIDENPMQHMVTYTVAFGVVGTLSTNPPDKTTPFAWPQPTSNSITTADDMRHAAWNGRGLFMSAGSPQTLVNALAAAVQDISAKQSTAAAVSFNSTSLQTDTLVYQALFDSSDWHGDLLALEINSSGIGSVKWQALNVLNATATSARNLVTWNGTSAVNFTWANLTPEQQADLCAVGRDWGVLPIIQWLSGWPAGCSLSAGVITGPTATAEKVVDFIKGDSTNEGVGPGKFRVRNGNKLADIVHSGPLFVGKPSSNYPNLIEGVGKEYSTFVNSKSTRSGMVYVGGNGAVLHAFQSNELNNPSGSFGNEVFGYIPNLVFSAEQSKGLHYLAEQQSPNTYKHRYYVDLSPTAADVYVNGAWKTVLLGGLRGGGKGIFALDITDPLSTPTTMPMWEFTHADMGYTFSEIRIARMNAPSPGGQTHWAAIFGNGYNSDPTGTGEAKLFIHYLDNSGTVVLNTKAGTMANSDCGDASSDCNGLSSPAIADLNGDGNADRIAAGDLHGNMWVFDVSATSRTSWKVAYGSTTTPKPLFVACRTASSTCPPADRQPITAKPALARHSTQTGPATAPNIMVFFGTGQYLNNNDNNTTDVQTFYGVWDAGTHSLRRSNLVEQFISSSSFTVGTITGLARFVTDNQVDYEGSLGAQKHGWYIDLPDSKERSVVTPHALGNLVFFNTMIPSTDLCRSGGDGWLMSVKQLNGGEPPQPVIDLDNNGVFNSNDLLSGHPPVGIKVEGLPTESRFISNHRVTATSKGRINFETIQPLPPSAPGRMSWTDIEL